MWQSAIILGEDDWQIDIVLGYHKTEGEATKEANSPIEAILVTAETEAGEDVPVIPAIRIRFNWGSCLWVVDDDVVITEISKEKQVKMGRPLDMSINADKETAITALLAHDPAYTIEEDDMVPSDKTLADFIKRYGVGYKLDNIAWGVLEVGV